MVQRNCLQNKLITTGQQFRKWTWVSYVQPLCIRGHHFRHPKADQNTSHVYAVFHCESLSDHGVPGQSTHNHNIFLLWVLNTKVAKFATKLSNLFIQMRTSQHRISDVSWRIQRLAWCLFLIRYDSKWICSGVLPLPLLSICICMHRFFLFFYSINKKLSGSLVTLHEKDKLW